MMAAMAGQVPTPTPQTSQMPVAPAYQTPIPTGQFQKLVGPPPSILADSHWNRWYDGDKGDKDPIPKWDGQNPAKRLKPWLKDLRLWRQETSHPVNKHGLKLYRSLEEGGWMKNAANRVPEEQLADSGTWEKILREILQSVKPYLDVETDVLIEAEFVLCKNTTNFQNAITRPLLHRLPSACAQKLGNLM